MNMDYNKKPAMENEYAEILLVDDNLSDAEMTIRALRKNNIVHTILHLKDGVEALDYLLGQGEYAGRDITLTPKITLLDLRMPRIDGIEVLTKIKQTDAIKHIPIVVLTSSNVDPNLEICMGLGAASFIVKPVNLPGFVKALAAIKMHWPTVDNTKP
ncbi:MAG: response regulator [Sphingobacteriales bacterium JAD_PAG50586_3]|nr:MAG: response regulator [Sphingobacteriales bacterium JAD_PAG50586_3]